MYKKNFDKITVLFLTDFPLYAANFTKIAVCIHGYVRITIENDSSVAVHKMTVKNGI